MRTLAALVESIDHVCCRYRLAAFRESFAGMGYRLELVPLPKSPLGRWRAIGSVRSADVVVLQRKLLSWFEVKWLRRAAKKFIFDFDDALWLRDSHAAKGFESAKRRRRFDTILKHCDAAVAGNAILAAEAAKFCRRVDVIPTCVDPVKYPQARHERTGAACKLVWIGSSSTLRGLEANAAMLNAIGRAIPGLELTVLCDRMPHFADLAVRGVPWSEATEAAELASADIGLGWVPDDPWSRGKCGLKLLQYHAAGLAVVANPVGVQVEIVRHGETGMLATTTDEWVAAMKRLTTDAELRKRLGMNGRARLVDRFSVARCGEAWGRLLAELAP